MDGEAKAIAAHKADMDFTFSTIDKIFRMSIGETGDYCAALYDGDYSIPLEEAQRRKHQYVMGAAGVSAGQRVLDVGCGWGGFLVFLKKHGVEGVGITPAEGQVAACVRNGLDVHALDYRSLTPGLYDAFDAVTSMGMFEHICTIEAWKAGKQDEIYRGFFKIMHEQLKPGGKLYVQCTAFGKNMIPYENVSLSAPKDSSEFLLALAATNWTYLWLPQNDDQIIEAAGPYFNLKEQRNGRLDYVQTIKEWIKRLRKFTIPKYLAYLSMVPIALRNKDMYRRAVGMKYQPHRVLLEREVLDFHRFVFEKI